MLKFFFSPLEQFEIFVYKIGMGRQSQLWATQANGFEQGFDWCADSNYVYQWSITISNAILTLLSLIFIVVFACHVNFLKFYLVPKNSQKMALIYISTIKKIIADLINHPISNNYYTSLFTFIFILINILNLFGLIPYTFVLTSQFFFTFGLAFIAFITINITGIVFHGFAFLRLFYPTGTPIFIVPLLILIEFVSYIARVFSLAIRLFANITAGHILVKILSWLTWMILDLVLLSAGSFIVISCLWVLEFFISILQAYVFLTLLCLYLNDVINLH